MYFCMIFEGKVVFPRFYSKQHLMKVHRQVRLLVFLAGFSAFFLPACRDAGPQPVTFPTAHDFDNTVIVRWNELFMRIDRYAAGYRPGPAPRALAYLGLSAYESCVSGLPDNRSVAHLFGASVPKAEEAEYYWPAAVNESYAYLMTRFFFSMENDHPDLFQEIEQLRLQLHNEFAQQTEAEVLNRSETFGRAVAQAVYDFEKTDAVGHNAFLEPVPQNYTPPQGPGLWQPTHPDYGRAMYPYWGQVRLFALRDDEKIARQPIPYSELPSSLFYSQAMEVFNTVNLIKNPAAGQEALAYEQQWIAEFWSDDLLEWTFSPPTRLVAVADQIAVSEHLDLGRAVELYAKLGIAMSDAGVAVWHSKFHYNVERPVSYIRRIVAQQHPEAAGWSTILRNPFTNLNGWTPAFPAYPSGHSGFSGAGGKILSSFFEYNDEHPGTYTFTDLCHQLRTDFLGAPRTFHSFKDLADEDAYSRIPLGVHYRMDCSEGLRLGELAAQRVLELPWKK
jgi:hypothetical protein